jgi:hypothetical protein
LPICNLNTEFHATAVVEALFGDARGPRSEATMRAVETVATMNPAAVAVEPRHIFPTKKVGTAALCFAAVDAEWY